MPDPPGVVYLVGAGPGDPGLITVRGLSLLRRADVILYDRLIPHDLLSLAAPDAERIDVGKSPGDHRVTQARIIELMITYAREGKLIVRLKGGDPYVFGRGFEEFSACREAGVACVVVPGVSSALAAPLAAGIPVTSRMAVRSVAIVTGSFAEECEAPPLDYTALAAMDTLIVMMGLAPLGEIASSLIEGGRDPNTPAACIENATTPAQRTVCATLGTIARAVGDAGLQGPVVTVVGAVAAEARNAQASVADYLGTLADGCQARNAPAFGALGRLAGRRIVVTRPSVRSRALRRALARAGADVIDYPLIGLSVVESPSALDECVAKLSPYGWVVFTSANAVQAFWRSLSAAKCDARSLAGIRVAAVGPVTSGALRRIGLVADLVPEPACASSLVDALLARSRDEKIRRVLFPCGDRARRTVPDGLRAAGIEVDEIVAYRTTSATPTAGAMARLRRGIDAVLFYSPSAVARYRELGIESPGAVAVCVGPTTADAAANAGFVRAVRLDKLRGSTTVERIASALSKTQTPRRT